MVACGIAKAADFIQERIRAVDAVNMCNVGYLDRIYYQLAVAETFSGEQFLAVLLPKGIVY